MSSSGSFKVFTPALAAAAVQIGSAADTVQAANEKISGIEGSTSFDVRSDNQYLSPGAEPASCDPANRWWENVSQLGEVVAALSKTLDTLTTNVAAAAEGYLITDAGVVPISTARNPDGSPVGVPPNLILGPSSQYSVSS